jgi:SAM-dependent methyltransferase
LAGQQRKAVYDDTYIGALPGEGNWDGTRTPEYDPVSWEATRLKYAINGHPTGRLLDVGCATGNFLSLVKERGWEIWGVEFNPHAAATAARRLNAEVLPGDLVDLDLPRERFDVVTLFHVIEHVIDPRRTVGKIREVLKRNGRLVLETPDFGSKSARRMGAKWPHVKPREHLYYFDEQSLRKLLSEEGFQINKVRRCGGLGVPQAGETAGPGLALKNRAFDLRRTLAPFPWLRNLARWLYWDILRQNEHILVVASRCS